MNSEIHQQSTLNLQLPLVKPFKFSSQPYEDKVVALRECPTPETLQLCDTPDKAAEYWRLHVPQNPYFNPECECFTVLLLNTRRRVKAHQIVLFGTHDTILVHPISAWLCIKTTAAAQVITAKRKTSGEPTPSEADIKVTRDLIRAGQLLKIEVLSAARRALQRQADSVALFPELQPTETPRQRIARIDAEAQAHVQRMRDRTAAMSRRARRAFRILTPVQREYVLRSGAPSQASRQLCQRARPAPWLMQQLQVIRGVGVNNLLMKANIEFKADGMATQRELTELSIA